mgnify:CR=1 FL=1
MNTPPPAPVTPEQFEQILVDKFPDFRPVRKAPWLFRLNGCGLGVVGKRKVDHETQTYLKSYAFTLVFIPILNFTSYRVTDSPDGGWYFHGKEKLGKFGKIQNFIAIAAIALLFGSAQWSIYQNSEPQRWKRELASIEETAQSGNKLLEAAAYVSAYREFGSRSEECAAGFIKATKEALDDPRPDVQAAAAEQIVKTRWMIDNFDQSFPNFYQDNIERAAALKESSPWEALQITNAVQPLAGSRTDWIELKKAILTHLVNSDEMVGESLMLELAELQIQWGDTDSLISTFEHRKPFEDGSPLNYHLGTAYLNVGRFEESASLLELYVGPRLPKWKKLVQSQDQLYENAYQRALKFLQDGNAPEAFYDRYENSIESAQNEMVDRFINERMLKDQALVKLKEDLGELEDTPGAMMDLGIACLRCGQSAAPESRDAWLKKAEQNFLKIGDYAGESTDFQFFLAQVYYWLGKPDKGEALFDKVINKENDPVLLYKVATSLREVGEEAKAIEVLEKAYGQAEKLKTDPDSIRSTIATERSILAATNDEQIQWLEKADQTLPHIQVRLNEAKANKAMIDNNEKLAESLYRKALVGYKGLQQSSSTLNNNALISLKLYSITGEKNDYIYGLEKMSKAVEMEPNDSILCQNAASEFFTAALRETIGSQIDPHWLQTGVSFTDLRWCYQDEESRTALIKKLTSQPYFAKGRQLLDRAMLLAPKSASTNLLAYQVAWSTRDLELLKQVKQRYLLTAPANDEKAFEEWLAETEDIDREEIKQSIQDSLASMHRFSENMTMDKFKAIAQTRSVNYQWNVMQWTGKAPTEEEITSLKVAFEKYPCSTLQDNYVDSLAYQFIDKQLRENDEFKAWLGDGLRGLSAIETVILARLKFPKLKDDPLLIKCFNESNRYAKQFPGSYGIKDVIIAALINDPQKSEIRQAYEKSELRKMMVEISEINAPFSASNLVVKFQRKWLADGLEAAKEEYNTSAAKYPMLPAL